MTSIYRYALALSMVAAAGALSAQNASTSSRNLCFNLR